MAFQRFGSAEVLSVHTGQDQRAVSMQRTAHRAVFSYEPREGYVYVRSRAISSRCNDNFDYFGPEEIEKAYQTFVGKPVFVNHHNSDHKQARGVIIDAALHKDLNPNGSPDTWVEVLMEVDGVTYPKLAKALVEGDVDRTSMGCDVQISKCSICYNVARNPLEYCRHIPGMKGKEIWSTDYASGRKTAKLVYEECYGLSFFENSLLVEPPADPTAFFLGRVEVGPGLGHLAKAARLRDAAQEPSVPDPMPLQRTASRQSMAAATDAHIAQMSADNLHDHLHSIENDPHAQEGGMSWYHHGNQIVHALSDIYKTPPHKVAAVIAAYSPKSAPAPNLSSAISALHAGEAATPENHTGPLSLGLWEQAKPKVDAILKDKSFDPSKPEEFFHRHLGHVKTSNFGMNLYDPSNPNHVTTDTHHAAALAGWHGVSGQFGGGVFSGGHAKDGSPKAGQQRYDATVRMTQQATDTLNHHPAFAGFRKSLDDHGLYLPFNHGKQVIPHQVQAMAWGVQQQRSKASMEAKNVKALDTNNQNGVDKLQDHYLHRDSPFSMLHPNNWKSFFGATPRGLQQSAALRQAVQERESIRVAYNEVKAPQDVDTLREESCEICSNDSAFNGRECQVCGFIRPPKGLDDPDVDKAKQLDQLKQSIDDTRNQSGADPSQPGADFDAGDLSQADPGGDNTDSPWLACPSCSAELRPGAAQTTTSDPAQSAPQGLAEGDPCPVCGEGPLASTAESEDATDQSELQNEEAAELGDPDTDGEPDQGDDDGDEDDDPKAKSKKNPAGKTTAAMKYRDHSKEFPMGNRQTGTMQNGLQTLASIQEDNDALARQNAWLRQRVASQGSQIQRLAASMAVVARYLGPQVDTEMRRAAFLKRADEQNPAQPVPEPAAQPPVQTTVQAETPEAFADVMAPGMVPGSNNDVAADAVSTTYTPGADIATSPLRNLVDVTAPVEGTQGPRPLSEVKTNVEVRAGNGMNPQVAYPLGGPFANAQRTGAQVPLQYVTEAQQAAQGASVPQRHGDNEIRVMASIRLARLRQAMNMAPKGEGQDLIIGQRIASDASVSMEQIQHEIKLLNEAKTANAQQVQQQAPRGVVPRQAVQQQRIVPPLGYQGGGGFSTTASSRQSEDEDLAAALS